MIGGNLTRGESNYCTFKVVKLWSNRSNGLSNVHVLEKENHKHDRIRGRFKKHLSHLGRSRQWKNPGVKTAPQAQKPKLP